jgi:hypothetical protein
MTVSRRVAPADRRRIVASRSSMPHKPFQSTERVAIQGLAG